MEATVLHDDLADISLTRKSLAYPSHRAQHVPILAGNHCWPRRLPSESSAASIFDAEKLHGSFFHIIIRHLAGTPSHSHLAAIIPGRVTTSLDSFLSVRIQVIELMESSSAKPELLLTLVILTALDPRG